MTTPYIPGVVDQIRATVSPGDDPYLQTVATKMADIALTKEEKEQAFQAHLAELASHYAIDMADAPTADQILSGLVIDTNINFDQFCLILPEVFADLANHRAPADEKGKRPFTSLGYARADNFLKWLMLQEVEWMVMGGKIALSVYKLPFNAQKMPNFNAYALTLKKYIGIS